MEDFKFWNNWKPAYRNTFLFTASLSVIFLLIMGVAQYSSTAYYYPLNEVRKTEGIEVDLHQLDDAVFKLSVPIRSYVIFQAYLAIKPANTQQLSIIYFCLIALLMSFVAVVLTYLSRLWFAVGQSFIIIWIVTLKLPYLDLFNLGTGYFHYIFIILFLVLGYVFRAVYPNVTLLNKFLAFILLTASLLAIIILGSSIDAPLFFVSQHSIIVPIFISIIFIGNIAYDILLLVLRILSNKQVLNDSSNLKHFLTFGIIYLVYITLTLLRNNYTIKWDLIYFDEFLLLAISSIVGLWGFKKRNELIKEQLHFVPLGAFLYLAALIITILTIIWVFLTANDSLIDVFEDAIIFSHVGFGLIFFLYVLINFFDFLKKGYGIFPVLFQPKRLPAGVLRVGGLIIITLLIIRANYTPYYQAWSGYYNSVADYYQNTNKNEAAYTSRQIARQYAFTTHKSNFMLALDAYKKKDWTKAAHYFGKANYKRPSVQAFINKAQAEINGDKIFESLFTLQKAEESFPDNHYINNMKGLVFEELNEIDSAFLYFNAAKSNSVGESEKMAYETNILGVLAKHKITSELDTNLALSEASVPLKANYLAFSNLINQSKSHDLNLDVPTDSILTYNDFSYLFNYLTNASLIFKRVDYPVDEIKNLTANEPFSKSLSYADAVNKNYSGQQKQAFELIVELENDNISDAAYYQLLHALWLLDQEAYEMAYQQLIKAEKFNLPYAAYLKVIALIKQGRLYEAAVNYERLENAKTLPFPDQLELFFQAKIAELNSGFKLLWLTSNPAIDSLEQAKLIQEIKGSNYHFQYLYFTANDAIRKNDFDKAEKIISEARLLKLPGEAVRKLNNIDLLLTVKDDKRLENMAEVDYTYTTYPKNYQLLAKAVLAKQAAKSSTDSLMLRLANENVFFAEGVLYAVDYFNNIGKEQLAYDALVDASRLNTESIAILKAYALQSLKLNIRSYAYSALEELELKLSQEEYDEFKANFKALESETMDKAW